MVELIRHSDISLLLLYRTGLMEKNMHMKGTAIVTCKGHTTVTQSIAG
jgi:hypothetical protein